MAGQRDTSPNPTVHAPDLHRRADAHLANLRAFAAAYGDELDDLAREGLELDQAIADRYPGVDDIQQAFGGDRWRALYARLTVFEAC